MKWLYLSNTRFPSERAHSAQIAHMCQAFAENGVDLTLVVNDIRTNTGENVEKHFGFKEKYKIERVRFGLLMMTYWKPSFVINNLFFTVFALIKTKEAQFNKIYVRDHWIAYFLTFFCRSSKIIFESHEAKYGFPVRRLISKKVKIVCISEGIYNFYLDKGVPGEKMLVAHDAVDNSFFTVDLTKQQSREKLGIDSSSDVVMYIGGLSPEKGIDTFCEAASLVNKARFYVIGGTSDQVSEYSAQYPKVFFLGSRDYSELNENQLAADVLVVPNSARTKVSSYYTSPLKLFAHMSSGVPLVLSDVPSLQNVIKQDDSNWFVADDPVSLAKQIKIVFSDMDSKIERSQKLKNLAKNYTWVKRASKVITFSNKHAQN